MLEIVFIIWFAYKLFKLAQSKGRSGAWCLLGIGMWIGAEAFGLGLGVLLDLGMAGYLIAIGCAIVSAVVSYGIVNSLSPTEFAPDPDLTF